MHRRGCPWLTAVSHLLPVRALGRLRFLCGEGVVVQMSVGRCRAVQLVQSLQETQERLRSPSGLCTRSGWCTIAEWLGGRALEAHLALSPAVTSTRGESEFRSSPSFHHCTQTQQSPQPQKSQLSTVLKAQRGPHTALRWSPWDRRGSAPARAAPHLT